MFCNFRKTFPGFFLFVVFLFFPVQGQAVIETFSLSGSGSFLLNPAGFSGIIYSGTLNGATFTIYVDDTWWPQDDPETPENERWEYIVEWFFTYDPTPGSENWKGYFPRYGFHYPIVTWRFYNSGDDLGGIIEYLNITINDKDHDGVMDQDDLMNQAVAGQLQSLVEYSLGQYGGMCGFGSMNGNIQDYDPSPTDIITLMGFLSLGSCTTDNERTTWGAVKSIYSE